MAHLSEKRLLLSRTRGACAGTGAHLTPKPQAWKLVLPHEQVAEVTAQPHSPGDKGEEPRERPLPSSPAPQPAVRDMAAAPGRHRAPAGPGATGPAGVRPPGGAGQSGAAAVCPASSCGRRGRCFG